MSLLPFSPVVALVFLVPPPFGATETDDRIVSAARESYVFKTYLKDDSIQVAAKNGAVTLTGKVQDELHRSLAEEVVAGLPGVKSVNNQLSLQNPPTGGGPDQALKARVLAAFKMHRRLGDCDPEVHVEKGVVTLKGKADTRTQKHLATAYVKGMDGVVRVDNQMSVAQPPHPRGKELRKKIDDASITAQVKLALLFNRATSALNTKVHTENGTVYLNWIAKSKTERDLVTRLARNVEGVKGVRNKMTIEG